MDIEFSEAKEFIISLNSFLGPTTAAFNKDGSKDRAIGLRQQQEPRWRRLQSILSTDQSNTWIYHPHLQHLNEALGKLFDKAECSQNGDGWVVSSQLPILENDVPNSLVEQGIKFKIEAASVLAYRCRSALSKLPHGAVNDFSVFAIPAAMNDVLLSLGLHNNDKKYQVKLNELSAFQIRFEEKEKKLDAISADLDKQVVTIAASYSDMSDSFENQFQTKLKSFESAAQLKAQESEVRTTDLFAGIRKETMEFTKLKASTDLWSAKASWHLAGAVFFGSLFLIGLALIPTLLYLGKLENYISILIKVPSDHQFLGIALLLIPTLAVAWSLRFVAKIALQNLALQHDAQLRHSQVVTYLRLLSDPSKPITENERVLALYALFRPLPNTYGDEVNPPTLADLIKEHTIDSSNR